MENLILVIMAKKCVKNLILVIMVQFILSMCLDSCLQGYAFQISAFSFSFLFFFFFFFTRFREIIITCHSLQQHCSRTIHGTYSHFIQRKNIKNGFHDTIHIFKNYFATLFSVFSFHFFSFSKNKLYSNGPLVPWKFKLMIMYLTLLVPIPFPSTIVIHYQAKMGKCPFHTKNLAFCPFSETNQGNALILKLNFQKIEFQMYNSIFGTLSYSERGLRFFFFFWELEYHVK